MTADPLINEPLIEPIEPDRQTQDPIDLLIAIEKASETPIRPEYIEGMVVVPPQPDDLHNRSAFQLAVQLSSAGVLHAGIGNGYRTGVNLTRP